MKSISMGRIVRSKSGNLVFSIESDDGQVLQDAKEYLRKKLIFEGVTVSAKFGIYDSDEVLIG